MEGVKLAELIESILGGGVEGDIIDSANELRNHHLKVFFGKEVIGHTPRLSEIFLTKCIASSMISGSSFPASMTIGNITVLALS